MPKLYSINNHLKNALMTTKLLIKKISTIFSIALIAIFYMMMASCRKELSSDTIRTQIEAELISDVNGINGNKKEKIVNPFSIKNIRKAKKTLRQRKNQTGGIDAMATNNDDDVNPIDLVWEKTYLYCAINPNSITPALFTALEDDETIQLMDFPFADPMIYQESYGFNETKAAILKDGNIYAVIPTINPVINSLPPSDRINIIIEDTLVEPVETDTALQFQALREAGIDEATIERICLFKRPHGVVQ